MSLTLRAAHAQPAKMPPPKIGSNDAALDVAALQARLDALNRELQTEQALQKTHEKRRATEIGALRDERKVAAKKLLSAQLERQRNATQLDSLKTENNRLAATSKELAEQSALVPSNLRAAAEQLRRHLSEVPGSEASLAKLQNIIAALTNPRDDVPATKNQAVLRELFDLLEKAQAQSATVGVVTAELFTANGERERVKLLHVGHVRFAYQTIPGNRVGLPISGSQSGLGIRWTEAIEPPTQDLVRQAIAACESSSGDWLTVPLDVSGRGTQSTSEAAKAASRANRFKDLFDHGGLVMWPLVFVSILAVSVIFDRVIASFRFHQNFPRAVETLRPLVQQRNFDQAEEWSARRGPYSWVTRAYLRHRDDANETREDVLQREGALIVAVLDRRLRWLAVLAQVGTLMGLFGTFYFMIYRFNPESTGAGQMQQTDFFNAIRESFIPTMCGLVIAVLCTVTYHLLEARIDAITRQMGVLVSYLDEWLRIAAPSNQSKPDHSIKQDQTECGEPNRVLPAAASGEGRRPTRASV